MVLLADLAGDDEAAPMLPPPQVVAHAEARGGEGFIASSGEARKKFWLDRSRTAAIAAHTNAFKVNEDVVIPLARLGDYTDGIERINIELSTQNKLELLDDLEAFLRGDLPVHHQEDDVVTDPASTEERRVRALELLRQVRQRWAGYLDDLDAACPPTPAAWMASRCTWAAAAACSGPCRTTACGFPGRREVRDELRQICSPVGNTSRCWRPANSAISGFARAGSSSPCTCTPATATCTPTSR
jgi:FAD/FMN-containing dehydrogenase